MTDSVRPGAGDDKIAQRLRERHHRRAGIAGFRAFAGDDDRPGIHRLWSDPCGPVLSQNQRLKLGLFQFSCLSTGVKKTGLCQLMSRLMNS